MDLLRGLPDISLNSVGQTGTVEVEQQPEMQAAGSEVAKDLRLEDRIKARHTLHFDDDRAFDDEVDPVVPDAAIAVRDPDDRLPIECDSLRAELES